MVVVVQEGEGGGFLKVPQEPVSRICFGNV